MWFANWFIAPCEAKFLEDEIKERKAMLAKTEHDIVKVVEEIEMVEFVTPCRCVLVKRSNPDDLQEKEAARKEHKKLRAQLSA